MSWDGLERLTKEHVEAAENPEIVQHWIQWKVNQMSTHDLRSGVLAGLKRTVEEMSTHEIAKTMSWDEYDPNEGVDTFIVGLQIKARDFKNPDSYFKKLSEETIINNMMDMNSVLQCEVVSFSKVE